MAALFPEWSNTALRLSLMAIVVLALVVIGAPMLYMRTPYNTSQFEPVVQPVEFDHRHHVVDDEIACLYCHRGAEISPTAGIPSTDVCMGCHAQIWNRSPLLEPVRRSYFTGVPIPWKRVYSVPDFTYFNHAIHVQRGIECARCHGRVETMAQVYRVAPLTMGWCLDCHRNPEIYVDANAGKPLPESTAGATLGLFTPEIRGRREITRLTTCTACHR
jgi:hypothetical protein